MENMDFISTLVIEFNGEVKAISEKNYKEALKALDFGITISENDNELIDERIGELIENWPNRSDKSYETFKEFEEKYENYQEQLAENKEFIRKCENTIELIEKFADLREWE